VLDEPRALARLSVRAASERRPDIVALIAAARVRGVCHLLDETALTRGAGTGGQGVEPWPAAGKNRTLLVDDRRLPFAAGSFDRILLVHALEEADDPAALLLEAVRALAPTGRIILAAAARGGLWARAENTPFGHGRPFTRGQLERLVREAGLEPAAWSQTLYVPPWTPLLPLADGFEQVGRRIAPNTAGVILLEASRQAYARIRPSGLAQRVPARPALTPQPAASTSSPTPRPHP
jgi:SAM-dependent methyltransferase